ncbi:MAG: LysR family transcriptional regulator [Pseudomonadota bacterium]
MNDLLTFVAVANTGGVSSASRSLGISVATASHRIAKLEGALDLKLFHRNSRSVQLTGEGRIFLERVEPILAELREAELEAGSGTGKLKGHLRVTLSPWILSRFIMPFIDEFLSDNPELKVEFLAVDRYVSLVEEGVDCAIRVGVLADSALTARKLCANNRIICAAPSFCEKHGTPGSIDDLRDARWVCLPWQTRFEISDATRRARQLVIPNKISVSSSDMLTEAAVQGLGVAVKSRLAIKKELENGSLREVMPGRLNSSDAPISFVYGNGSRAGRKVHAFSELATKAFSLEREYPRRKGCG